MPAGAGAGDGKVLDAARELYALEPGEFTEARNRRAARLKDEGGTDAAAVVRRLKKPSTGAWVVNTAVREMPAEIEQLLELGAQLREATADLDAGQIRALDRQRRGLVAALVAQAARRVEGRGPTITQGVRDEVAATFHAAMADPAAADALRTGLLVRPTSSTGLGQTDLDGVLAVVGTAPAVRARRRGAARPGRRGDGAADRDEADRAAELDAAVRGAEAALENAREEGAAAARRRSRAEDDLADAVEAAEQLQARELQLRSELEELRRQVADHEHALERHEARLERADAERDEAEERARAAEEEVAAAEEQVTAAERALREARAAAGGTLAG